MKTIKNKLSKGNYGAKPVDDDEQSKYLRKIAYWIGYFIFEFNDLEEMITNLAAEHIDGRLENNEYAYIFLSGLMFNQKVELLERYYNFNLTMFAPQDYEAKKKEVDEIIGELKEVGKTRNTIVHANYYSLNVNGNIKGKTRFVGAEIEEHWVSITRDFLVESINQVMDLTSKIEEFDENLFAELLG